MASKVYGPYEQRLCQAPPAWTSLECLAIAGLQACWAVLPELRRKRKSGAHISSMRYNVQFILPGNAVTNATAQLVHETLGN